MKFKDLSFSYRDEQVFSGLSVASESPIIGLSGPPGCGKTTLLKLLAGVLSPSRVAHWNVPEHAVVVLQEDALLPWLTGWQNLEFVGLNAQEASKHELFPLVEAILAKKTFAMSYGQRRSVELFRAFSACKGFLCLDEPTNFLDEKTRNGFLNFLAEGRFIGTVVMSTHHTDELRRINADVLSFSGPAPISALERFSTWESVHL